MDSVHPAPQHSLISIFVVAVLIVYNIYIQSSMILLASVAEHSSLSPNWSHNCEDRF